MKTLLIVAGLSIASLGVASSAQADVVDLTFENIAPYPNNSDVLIENYYSGGTSSIGTSGTNYGISFSSNALLICLNSLSVSCSNTSRGGLGDPASQNGALFFLSGGSTTLNDSAGFTNGFSFNYVSASYAGEVDVYSGLDGTGSLLATIALSPNAGSCPGYGAGFCPFSPVGVTFAGTAESIAFGGVENQIVFDDITFGSATPGGPSVPEPATWAMVLIGFGLIGGALRKRPVGNLQLGYAEA